MKKIEKVGVVGAGTMGAAIAQKFAQEGFVVYLNDREQKYIDKGIDGMKETLNQGVKRKLFTPEKVQAILANIKGTANQEDLKACDLIVEAIFEDFEAKYNLFKNLDSIVNKDTILATNTSSFSVTELAGAVSNPERFVGLHYFYHAAKNRLVEIIPGENTSKDTLENVYRFSVLTGKDPIYTKDAYGFAVNRFFVPWLNESCKILGDGTATVSEIDAVCKKIFSIGMGPFALMNATGVSIALHAQKTLELFGPSYKVSEILVKQVESAKDWEVEEVDIQNIESDKVKRITERMMGCVFFVCSQILEEKVCTASALNRGAKIGLRWRLGPIDLMAKNGEERTKEMVSFYASLYNEKVPEGINKKSWQMQSVRLEIRNSVAVLILDNPESMNALNESNMKELEEKFLEAENTPKVETIFITGSGKAFVAGADIKFFVKNMRSNNIDNIVDFTAYGQKVFNKIDGSPKKVVALLNGLTLGGGIELALCADNILAVEETKIAFPETGIGIYPGLGGTWRSSKKVGKGLAKYLVFTGQMVGAKQAHEIGLIDNIISKEEIFDLIEGKKKVPEPNVPALNNYWKQIARFYEENNYQSIIDGKFSNGDIDDKKINSITKTIRYKAPVAMKISEELIDQSENKNKDLEKIKEIFQTEDALLGLTSMGQKVSYKGT